MVYSQIMGFLTAVLAPVLVTSEDLLFGELDAGTGAFNDLVQPNY